MLFAAAGMVSCGQSRPGKGLKSFLKIPRKYLNRDSLPKYIIPDKSYTYWEYDEGQMDTTKPGALIFSSGIKPPGLILKDPRGMMLAGCLPSFCYKYIAYVRDGKVGYIKDNPSLAAFIGKIDNLPEAILIAHLADGVFPDDSKEGGAYKIIPNGIDLVLTQYSLCPQSKQAIEYIFGGKGIVKKIKRRVYDKTGGCAVI